MFQFLQCFCSLCIQRNLFSFIYEFYSVYMYIDLLPPYTHTHPEKHLIIHSNFFLSSSTRIRIVMKLPPYSSIASIIRRCMPSIRIDLSFHAFDFMYFVCFLLSSFHYICHGSKCFCCCCCHLSSMWMWNDQLLFLFVYVYWILMCTFQMCHDIFDLWILSMDFQRDDHFIAFCWLKSIVVAIWVSRAFCSCSKQQSYILFHISARINFTQKSTMCNFCSFFRSQMRTCIFHARMEIFFLFLRWDLYIICT